MKSKLLVVALILAIASSSAVDCYQNGVGEWQILTKQNFSTQIRLHPHILLIVTVPWSGESRSLIKDVTQIVTGRQDEFNSLKLMIIHRNTETMLADAIGATERTAVLYYHHAVSYKYRGKLRAQNILYSIYPYMSVLPEELPLKSLNSPADLKAFLESTDKALILFEFCGWTPKLLAKEKNNVTETGIRLQGNHFGRSFVREMDGAQISKGNDNEKNMENGKLKCDAADGFSGIPLLGEFSLVNDSDLLQKTENMMSGVELSCKFKEFQQFDSFFSKFMSVAREFFLPPERHRFGLVSERSLLQHLDIGDSDSWLAMLYLAGCPSCSKILKEENDLKNILQMNNEIVAEVVGDGEELDTVLPANKPSVLLFVDRSSDLSETRRKSKEVLDTFRELALDYLIPYQISQKNGDWPGRLSVQPNQASPSASGHPKLKLSSTAKRIKFKDKMSIMVINEGKHITLDNVAPELQGNSLHEILEYLLQKKKQAKLSSLAKDVGFHLLSEDLDVSVGDASPLQTEIQSSQASAPTLKEGLATVASDPEKDHLPQGVGQSVVEHDENSKTANFQLSHHDAGKTTSVDAKQQLISEKHDQHLQDHDLANDKGIEVEEKSYFEVYNSGEPQSYFQRFSGSFLFSDGNYRLLRALTGGSTVPSLAIVDPTSQQHYVFPEEKMYSYSSLADFLHGFLNGSLSPYQRSDDSILQSSREATQPPFVNMDFHEVDSIPRLTTRTFSELVVDLNQSDNENAFHACDEDVLVLFSGGWCGFCQRMELVVRELYRSIKGYMKMLENGCRNGETDLSSDNLKKGTFKFPQIYLMDCTMNDCSSILMSLTKREVYPVLILFPAKKKAAIPYEGYIAVSDVIKFIADRGNNSHHLIGEKGIIRTVAEEGGRHQNLFKGSSPDTSHEEAPVSKESFHEVILKSGTPKGTNKDRQVKSHVSNGLHKTAHHLAFGSILIATDKLLNVQPFDNSKILLVKADQDIGFEGLIVNRHISWNSLQKLEEGLEFLKHAPLSFGGPVIKQGMPFVCLTRRVTNSQYPEVLPGIYFLDQSTTVNAIEELKSGNHSISDYWFFVGYSSWGWDQLFSEIAGGAWSISDESTRHVDWPQS